MKLFNRVCKLNFGISIAYQKRGVKHNNNPIERYNGKTKDRIKSIRSGFKSFDGAKAFMDLRRTIHNFVNPHQQLNGKTPAEMAEIKLKLGRMKLLKLKAYPYRQMKQNSTEDKLNEVYPMRIGSNKIPC